MARQATITDEQILDAARAVFLEEGFGAATLKIAQRAGVSEGTIFKRFQTKNALFSAALEIEYPPAWHRLAEERMGVGVLQENLADILLSLFSFHLDSVPRLLGRLGHPAGPPKPGNHPLKELPALDVAMLERYLEHEMAQGRLRHYNTHALASLIFGSLIHQSIHATMEQRSLSVEERRKIVDETLTILWNGIAPESA